MGIFETKTDEENLVKKQEGSVTAEEKARGKAAKKGLNELKVAV
jgi:hypothetical protein